MGKTRVAIVGAGWRAAYFVRVAEMLKDQFEITGMLVRSEEKAAKAQAKYGVPAYLTYDELLADKPDYVVVAVTRADNAGIVIDLLKRGAAVLAETPAADTVEDMETIWKLQQAGGKIQVAEQYFLYPSYEAKIKIAQQGYLGQVHNITLSALHEYHGISIMRLALMEGMNNATITARAFEWPVTRTQNRDRELLTDGQVGPSGRTKAEFVFDDGKVAFYDFDYIQYNSHIRGTYFNLQGSRGEIMNDQVCYLAEDNQPLKEMLTPSCGGASPGVESITFAGKAIYRNPFAINTMPEDETAIARMMVGMKEYIDTGKEIYPMADALQDAYLTALLTEAVKTGKPVKSETQIWAK